MKTLNEQVNRMKSLMSILTEDTEVNLDNVIEYLVRNTEIDYEEERLHFPSLYPYSFSYQFLLYPRVTITPIKDYIKNTGLTPEETHYVWGKYKDIIKGKIENWGGVFGNENPPI